ncbi:hypothetical protein Scep_001608 [Stephania cephalantha]|uniref:Uncharacterized protein n=1 Tax=Stephania cephalantha TaxID=152367 RepID=A0AAP0Q3I4_9MAGN
MAAAAQRCCAAAADASERARDEGGATDVGVVNNAMALSGPIGGANRRMSTTRWRVLSPEKSGSEEINNDRTVDLYWENPFEHVSAPTPCRIGNRASFRGNENDYLFKLAEIILVDEAMNEGVANTRDRRHVLWDTHPPHSSTPPHHPPPGPAVVAGSLQTSPLELRLHGSTINNLHDML